MINLDAIETERLLLRRPEIKDRGNLQRLYKDEKTRAFLGGPVSDQEFQERMEKLMFQWQKYQFGPWVVTEKCSWEMLGISGLHHSDEGIELSYMFFPTYWGKGYAYEVALKVIEIAFNILELGCIVAITQKMNERSCALLEKLGFVFRYRFERFNEMQCFYELRQNKTLNSENH